MVSVVSNTSYLEEFRAIMWRITIQLFLGQDIDSQNRCELHACGVTHILNCSTELACHFPHEFTYLQLHLKDPDPAFASKIEQACDFLDGAASSGIALVHCKGAVSRSPSIVLAYLCHQGRSLHQAVSHLSAILPTKPNIVFLQAIAEHYGTNVTREDLQSFDEQLAGNWSSPNSS